MSASKRTRFIGTLNNPQEHYKEFMAEEWLKAIHTTHKAVFTTGQLEKGEEGTLHLQWYIMFEKPGKRLTALKKVCPYTHWTVVDTKDSAWKYCHKAETRVEGPWEYGSRPLRQYVKGESTQARAEKNLLLLDRPLTDLVKDGTISIQSVPVIQRAREILKAEEANLNVTPLVGDLQEFNLWVYGSAGTGKTGYFTDYFADKGGIYSKDKSKYWNMYSRESAVIVDDIEKTDGFMLGNLKRWAQHQPFLAEDKYGGFTKIRPKYMVVTSNYPPEDIWPDRTERDPILRRFKVVHMDYVKYFPKGHPLHAKVPSVYDPSLNN